jgi:O-acetylserine/cysteine efflux transporter
MPIRSRLLAVLVTIIWGVNFVITDVALRDTPPLLLTALRFLVTAVPLVFFVPRPTARARYVIGYGLVFGIGKFGVLYIAMAHGMPAGLASLVLQAQALFSVLLASALLGERLRGTQLFGVLVGSAGIGLLTIGGGGTMLGIALTVFAAASWAVANVIVRASGERRPLSLLVYSSLVPPLPLLGLSAITDGPAATVHAITHLTLGSLLALLFIAYVSTLLGFGAWNTLIGRYGVARVAPFSLLVPVVGVATSAIVLGERVTPVTLIASLAVLLGLAFVVRRKPLGVSGSPVRAPSPASD